MEKQRCKKNGECRCKGFDGYCFYTKECEYKVYQNEVQKSPVIDFREKTSNYPTKKT